MNIDTEKKELEPEGRTNRRVTILIGLVLLGAFTRLIPHYPNFTSVGAIALFAAFTFRKAWLAYFVPLAAVLLSDVALHLVTPWPPFGAIQLFVLAACWMSLAGGRLLKIPSLLKVGGGAVGSSLVFFVGTNLGVLLTGGGFHSPMNLEGLQATFAAAIPFFQ
ncbi:MAG: hypothetical protein MK133_00905, partial [Planctomycetes bacterium]|nr:hypothetical protein [Planctomycetota bacterium]